MLSSLLALSNPHTSTPLPTPYTGNFILKYFPHSPFKETSRIPFEYRWSALVDKDGEALELHYKKTLEVLGKESGLLGIIFRKSQNKIQDPAKLKRLISLINEETWLGLDIDIKGEIYEGLLTKNAEDTKSTQRYALWSNPIGENSNCIPRLLIPLRITWGTLIKLNGVQ